MSDAVPRVSGVARALNKWTAPGSAPSGVLRFHKWLYARSDGRVGHGMIGAPTLLLHTIGRRSGHRRTTALVYGRDGDAFVLAASNDGSERHPAWLLNLRSNRRVELQVARRHLIGDARVVEASQPDYARLGTVMNATNNSRYDHYQAKTSRPIPVVVITPSST